MIGQARPAPPPPAQLNLDRAEPEADAAIPRLQAFLRTHPEHLEARADLLHLLRRQATAQTRVRLGLAGKSRRDLPEPSPAASAAASSEALPLSGQALNPQEDLEIWASYATELDRAFQNGSWKRLDLGLEPVGDPPAEASSPTMQALYLRHLSKVEAALISLPESPGLWQLWLTMSAVAGRSGRSRGLVQNLVTPPPELRMPWPPQGLVPVLVLDAQRSGQWALVRELLTPYWAELQARIELVRGQADPARADLELDWSGRIGPLLEALIRLQADSDATHLVLSLAQMGGPGRGLVERAVLLAKACQRQDLARRWAGLRR